MFEPSQAVPRHRRAVAHLWQKIQRPKPARAETALHVRLGQCANLRDALAVIAKF
jgi:hypothetical protein